MKSNKINKRIWFSAILLIAVLLFASCSLGQNENAEPFEPFYSANSFNPSEWYGGCISADFSTASQGYIGLQSFCNKQIVVQVVNEECTYNFFAPQDSSVFYIPVNCGDGDYTYRFMQNTSESKYFELDSTTKAIALDDENAPFIHANLFCMYSEDSECVAKAAELAAESTSELDFVKSVYSFVGNRLAYDNEKAETVSTGYIPSPDAVYEECKGICFDYSSLAAAMLRSQGIPTKIITGYVGKDAAYHAWNAVYTKESGWISIEIQLKDEDWTRMDVTFSDKVGSSLLSYVDRYIY